MVSRFIQRAEKDIIRRLSMFLERELKDPRLEGRMIAFSGVRLSADLSLLKCWVVVNEPPEVREEVLTALRSAVPYLRRRLGETMRLRIVPRLEIIHDDTPDKAFRIEAILRELEEERASNAPDAGTDDAGASSDDAGGAPEEEARDA